MGVALAADPSRELIVRFDDDATAAGRLDAREGARTDFEHGLPLQGMQLVSVGPGQSVAVAERALESDPDVLYAEPNAIRHASLVPNDPYFSQLWALLSPLVRVSLAPGVSKRVVLRLNRAGRARLRRNRALALTLAARATDTAGNRRTLDIGMRTRR